MPLMAGLMRRFAAQQPFAGLAIAACLHVTAETAMMVRLLRAGGAQVSLAASNPLSTQDDIAAALAVRYETAVFARAGVDRRGYYRHIELALGHARRGPDLVLDDGGDLVEHAAHPGGGPAGHGQGRLRVDRHRRAAAAPDGRRGRAGLPGRRGARHRGQAPGRGHLRDRAVGPRRHPAGHQHAAGGQDHGGGRVRRQRPGVAERARGLGAQVIVTEIDPVRALEASLYGFRVLPMTQAAPLGEVFVTATGSCDVIGAAHIAAMRDGAILANAGHFDVEIDVRALTDLATAVHQDVRPHVDAYDLGDGRTMLLLAEGRVVNLVAAEGHPPEVMDVAFGIEALALAWLLARYPATSVAARQAPARRVRGARRHRRRGGPARAGRRGHHDRRAHPRAAGLPGILALGS